MTDCTTFTPREINLVHARALEEDAARNRPPDTMAAALEAASVALEDARRTVFPPATLGRISYVLVAGCEREVDGVAAQWGVRAAWNSERTHYCATLDYGRHVAMHITYVRLRPATPAPREAQQASAPALELVSA